ncbi:ArsR/SmtB family transcription factor [Paenibacillus eucommiae]|uniref:DNA-binding transcriptional ArsR family regulator n=1 Tax=Paenibacillus eucommiae TaxID=1355755 RepID=A0ABS4IWE0_9BACL|nr:metalloregulator ArsR/SmtB family transcription factor [Paenibacillus eucommiae]MBP1991894.1 DNA-binding transcriptional ArsR family regulator [Paenibacillus eucommiae]
MQSIDLKDLKSVTRFLTAFGDPIRIQILTLLGKDGRSNVGEIASHFELSRPAISHHLKVLRDANIVDSQKIGQEVYYWFAGDSVVASFRTLADMAETFRCGE